MRAKLLGGAWAQDGVARWCWCGSMAVRLVREVCGGARALEVAVVLAVTRARDGEGAAAMLADRLGQNTGALIK